MSDFTVDDIMAEIRYELDEREIYNDIRSEIGTLVSETVVDADPTYNWQVFTRYATILPGESVRLLFSADYVMTSEWQLFAHVAIYKAGTDPSVWLPYYDYSINIGTTSAAGTEAAVDIRNTGIHPASFVIGVKYKYLAAESITHEEMVPTTLTVRATDAASISKYGRRVMNLTWSEGTPESEMQVLVDHYRDRYKEPAARLRIKIKGKTDILRTQILTREISDLITVVCTNLGLNADCFINSVSINAEPGGMPVCTWGVELQRASELLTIFDIDTSELDGAHILGF